MSVQWRDLDPASLEDDLTLKIGGLDDTSSGDNEDNV
jgi:hypothetical protein